MRRVWGYRITNVNANGEAAGWAISDSYWDKTRGAQNWQYNGRTPATLAEYHSRAIRYSLGLPGVACAVLGLSNADEVHQAVEVARHYKPLSAEEKTALLKQGKQLAQARGLYYGPISG